MKKGAHFSDCKKHRYALWRIWDESKPLIQVIGLNPSTADETEGDPTIGFVTRIMQHHNYGGFYMTNLFSFITPYPKELQRKDSLDTNIEWLMMIRRKCHAVVFAWGAFDVEPRDREVIGLFPEALCLGKNKNGSPRHPMYKKADTLLIHY